MKIKATCPVCRANNELTPDMTFCRRCREDLSLLYDVKGYSYKYRIYTAQLLARNEKQQALKMAALALSLDRPA